jgi:hypothetical protein
MLQLKVIIKPFHYPGDASSKCLQILLRNTYIKLHGILPQTGFFVNPTVSTSHLAQKIKGQEIRELR